MNLKEQLISLKHQLYHALLVKPAPLYTDTEIEIAYQLSIDKDIQRTLSVAARSINKNLKGGK